MSTSQKPTLTIYHDPLSQPARSVVMLCIMAKVPFNSEYTSVVQGVQRSEDFTKLNPNKKVPAMTDIVNGKQIVLFESSAIMRYICNRYLPPDNQFYPRNDPVKIGKIEEGIAFHHKKIRPGARAFFSRNLAPFMGLADKFDPEEETRQATLMAEKAERIYRDNGGVVNSTDYTIADLLILAEVGQYVYGNVILEKFPFIVKRLEKMFLLPELEELHETFWENIAAMKFPVPVSWEKFLVKFHEEEE